MSIESMQFHVRQILDVCYKKDPNHTVPPKYTFDDVSQIFHEIHPLLIESWPSFVSFSAVMDVIFEVWPETELTVTGHVILRNEPLPHDPEQVAELKHGLHVLAEEGSDLAAKVLELVHE